MGWKAYQALENTSTICCDTGRNVPQLVLELGQLELVGDLLGAQVWERVSLDARRRGEKRETYAQEYPACWQIPAEEHPSFRGR